MAAQEDMEAKVEKEWEIPVFTVVKNNAILKNIFLVNSPPSLSEIHREDSSKIHQDLEQILLVGRHPDCDIRLEHPSISRFHLRIHSKPSSKRLSVTDLSSVHGTWISEKRLEPNIRVDVNEGDVLRIGGSSRVYRLQWIPFHKAYDMNNPFVPPLDVPPVDEETEEEMKRDEKALELENEVRSADSAFEGSKELYSSQYEISDEMEDENAVACKNEDGKPFDSASEASKYLVFNPNLKPFEEAEVLSAALLPEAMKTLDVPLGNRDMQFVNFAWEGSEVLLLGRSPPLVALEESDHLHRAQENDYSHDVISKDEELPLMLKFKDEMNFSGDIEDEEKEGGISGSSTVPMGELEVDPSKEDEYETTPFAECISLSPPIESIRFENENHQIEEEKESSKVLLLSDVSPPIEVQWESHSGLALTSNLMKNLDDGLSEFFADEMSYRDEHLRPLCNDDAWSFWSLSSQGLSLENCSINIDKENQGLEGEKARKERNSLEDTSSGLIESTVWSFWSTVPGAEFACSSSLSDSEIISQVEAHSTNQGLQFLHPMEKLCGKPSEESSSDRVAPDIWPKIGQSPSAPQVQTHVTLEEKIGSIGVSNEVGMLNEGRYEPIRQALFTGMDLLDEEYFTPEKENYTPNAQVAERKSGKLKDDHLCTLEESSLSSATAKAGIDSEKSFSAYSRKENKTPKVLQEQKSARHTSAKHKKLSILTKRGKQRTPLQTLFADSPQKNNSETYISGASMSGYSNKENQTPNVLQLHKSAEQKNLSKLVKKEAQRKPLQTLFVDSPQRSISKTHISRGASLSACSNKENQTPKSLQDQKSARHSSSEQTNLFIPRKRKAERMPLQTLFVDSPQESISDAQISGVPARSRDFTNYENSMDKNNYSAERVKKWTMVVDLACLLNNNSRKALQLLEGIKGTQLIIPRAVVKEVDFMKQQASIFRKNTDAYLASQWIEECLVRTKWWIRVQSSMEDEGRSPPAPPSFQSSQQYPTCLTSYIAYGSLPQVVNPSAEDCVLDHALFLRRMQKDGQLVLLSDNATMKIKAMAEGLICETAQEFRENLVNPFSNRFLWVDSLPRGQTWSYFDVLRENFYPSTIIKGVENAKGLKLILPHNSRYR